MPSYIISKSAEGYYIIFRDRRPFNPEIHSTSLMQVLAGILFSSDSISEINVKLGQEVSSEKDAQSFKTILSILKSGYRAADEPNKLEKTIRDFPPEMPVADLVQLLENSGLIGRSKS